jgi:hypothetical protein
MIKTGATMSQPICIYCEQDDSQVPLIPFMFRGATYAICPQHLPILIHKPEQLANKLPDLPAGLEGHAG